MEETDRKEYIVLIYLMSQDSCKRKLLNLGYNVQILQSTDTGIEHCQTQTYIVLTLHDQHYMQILLQLEDCSFSLSYDRKKKTYSMILNFLSTEQVMGYRMHCRMVYLFSIHHGYKLPVVLKQDIGLLASVIT